MPSLLFLNRVYPPAQGATGQLLAELAPELVRLGWQVTVLTSRADGNVPRSEVVEGVRVERVGPLPLGRTKTSEGGVIRALSSLAGPKAQDGDSRSSSLRAGIWRRALGFLWLYPALLRRALSLPRADVVVTLTDPPMLALLGPVLQNRKRSRLVHWAQDLYPEVAEELGVLRKGGRLACGCRRLSTWALRRHDAVIAVGRCMRQRLLERGLPPTAIEVIPNWALGQGNWAEHNQPSIPGTPRVRDPSLRALATPVGDRQVGSPLPKIERPASAPAAPGILPFSRAGEVFRKEHQLQDKFVVMYSGNLGLAHPFDAILDAAALLQIEAVEAAPWPTTPDAAQEVVFLFVGTGPRLPWVQAQVQARGLRNVRFLPPQPRERLAESLGAADVHLVTMHPRLNGLVVPSKVYGVLAAGRPCVFLGPEASEVACLLREHACGEVLPAPSGPALTECLRRWRQDTAGRQAAGERALVAAAADNLARATAAFDRLFRRLMGQAPEQVCSLQAA